MKVSIKRITTRNIDKIIRNAQEFSMLSYDFEDKREQSLINQSSQILTAFSIISAALLMVVPIINSSIPTLPVSYTLFCLGITLTLLIISMILAILVQWRYKYQALPSPISIYSHFQSNIKFFEREAQRSKSWIETMNVAWESKRKINNKRVKLITISMIIFFGALSSIIASVIYGIVTY